jgi:homoserine dehydrogenase
LNQGGVKLTIKVAILGYGTVGEGVYKSIQTHQEKLKEKLGDEVEVAGILVRDPLKKRDVLPGTFITTHFEEILEIPGLHAVFEAIVGEEPGYSYLSRCIEKGCHVITANKVLFAKYGNELLEKGKHHGVHIGFEATTAGAVPIIRTLQQILKINQVTRIQGILNGTSNFILTEMRANQLSFADALKLAQDNGYAEANPENDVEGKDAACKLRILCQLAFGRTPDWEEVEVEGISAIESAEVQKAEAEGFRFKHIADIREESGKLRASVKPILVSSAHPLFSVEGVDNAITLETSLAGNLTFQGPGAGKFPTASAMLEDFSDILEKSLRSAIQLLSAGVPV